MINKLIHFKIRDIEKECTDYRAGVLAITGNTIKTKAANDWKESLAA
ncbi:hypothetical protein [Methyloglobulus sp.]